MASKLAEHLDFYATLGVAVPGGVLLFGLSLIVPELKAVFISKDIGLGNLGVFLLVSYAAGQFVQAAGNVVEWLWWKCWQGLPTDWPRSGKHKLLSEGQVKKLGEQITTNLTLGVFPRISGADEKSWFAITRQIHAAVSAAERADRVERFNANYGLNRGLASALLILAVLLSALDISRFAWALGAVGVAAVFLLRMHRFGKYYARELFVQFLQIPSQGNKNAEKRH